MDLKYHEYKPLLVKILFHTKVNDEENINNEDISLSGKNHQKNIN